MAARMGCTRIRLFRSPFCKRAGYGRQKRSISLKIYEAERHLIEIIYDPLFFSIVLLCQNGWTLQENLGNIGLAAACCS